MRRLLLKTVATVLAALSIGTAAMGRRAVESQRDPHQAEPGGFDSIQDGARHLVGGELHLHHHGGIDQCSQIELGGDQLLLDRLKQAHVLG